MEEVSKGMMWRIIPSTLALFASDDWSPLRGVDEESNAERSPRGSKNYSPAEMATAIPLESTSDIADLNSEMSRLEKWHEESARSIEV